MSRLGLILYFLTRFWDRAANRFWTFTLDSFLRHKAKSYGSVHFYGPSRVVNAQGLTAGSKIHVNLGAWWVCDDGLTIGDNCHFGKDSTIYTRNGAGGVVHGKMPAIAIYGAASPSRIGAQDALGLYGDAGGKRVVGTSAIFDYLINNRYLPNSYLGTGSRNASIMQNVVPATMIEAKCAVLK